MQIVAVFIDAARALYLFSPLLASSALSAVVLRFDLLPALKAPIDGGATCGRHRLFGDHKTYRGFAVAIVGCVVTVTIQKYVLEGPLRALALLDYRRVSAVGFGACMGLGAMVGELPNSYLKRRLGVAPGGVAAGPLSVLFYAWDQVDLLTVAWPAVLPWVRPTLGVVATSFGVALALHPLVSLVGFVLGARERAR